MNDKLSPAASDVADSIAFALRINRRKRYHEGDKLMADLTADHIVRHLGLAGDVIMKKPPALEGATVQGEARFRLLGPQADCGESPSRPMAGIAEAREADQQHRPSRGFGN